MGLAYLPDGRRMEYEEYLKTPEWRRKKVERLAVDNWQCGICHRLLNDNYETHHISYLHLGSEDVDTELISICHDCHVAFHHNWTKSSAWESSPYNHWKDFSLKDTAILCYENQQNDIIFGGQYNLCNLDTIKQIIDDYFDIHEITEPIRICEEDIRLFFRNKRYELFLEEYAKDDFELEGWLDSRYGPKGGKGGNRIRSVARSFFTKHSPSSIKRIYKESDNANILMKEVRDYAETKRI